MSNQHRRLLLPSAWIALWSSVGTSCAERSTAAPPARPPSVQATFHGYERSPCPGHTNPSAHAWTVEVREYEVRDIVGEASWVRCRLELQAHGGTCTFEVAPGMDLVLGPGGPSLACISLDELGESIRADGKFAVRRDEDGATELRLYADLPHQDTPPALPGPDPMNWGSPVFASGGTLMRAARRHGNGLYDINWSFNALPEEALAMMGWDAAAGCANAIRGGWSVCSFMGMRGATLVVSGEHGPRIEIEPRQIGYSLRRAPRVTLDGPGGPRLIELQPLDSVIPADSTSAP